jgi:phenylacetate-CoA ligase
LSGKLAAIRTGVQAAALPGWGPSTDLCFETGPSFTLNINTDLDLQLEWLREHDADYVITYPSNLRGLLQRALASGIRLPRLRQVRTYGEALPAELRELCARAWGVPLVDLYSAQEIGYIALQCPRAEHYHVQAENVLVEILDERNAPCAPGQVGRVVLTNLNNFARPMIRYEIGDYAAIGVQCACGRGLPVLQRIAGRVRNVVTLPDGRQHWASFPASKWANQLPVSQLQLVQTARETMVARIVAPRPFTESELASLIGALQDCLGYPFEIRIERVTEIARGPGFKFEEFVSLL